MSEQDDWLDGAGPFDAPPAPDYGEAPEEALDLGAVSATEWRSWPTWAKLRLLRRLRTEGAGRPEQYVDPASDWYLWMLLGGRGSGKSDEASRWAAEEALRVPGMRFALVGRTFGDVRDTMFEGETGLLAVIPDSELLGGSRERAYNRSLGELFLANGSRFKGFSSEKPNQLRGPQHHRAWIDEASSWADAELGNVVDTTISNLMLGLRLKPSDGSGVRMVCSTTPKPNELTEFLHDLAQRKGQVRVLSTYSNLRNLDEAVADVILSLYEGTEVAAQELEGKILAAAKGAAFTDADITTASAASLPAGAELEKTVVGVDPAVTSRENADETGLVVASRYVVTMTDERGRPQRDEWLKVEADLSGKIEVADFSRVLIATVDEHEADELIVEVNNGFDFVVGAVTGYLEREGGAAIRRTRKDRTSPRRKVREVVEYVCETPSGHAFVLKPVWQSADKMTRARTASAWWVRKRAIHAESFPKLEKQMTTFDGTGKKSPDRLDALTSAVAGLSVGRRTRAGSGASPVARSGAAPRPVKHPLLQDAPARSARHAWSGSIWENR